MEVIPVARAKIKLRENSAISTWHESLAAQDLGVELQSTKMYLRSLALICSKFELQTIEQDRETD